MSDRKPQWAIGLQYLPDESPIVLGKAQAEMAARMVEQARALGIPIQEDPALAAALAQVPDRQPIPEALYGAVAELLAWLFWLEGRGLDDARNDGGRNGRNNGASPQEDET